MKNTEMYRDFFGCFACIRNMKSGSARLTVKTAQGKLILARDYKTRKGAKIAMGKLSDCWHEYRP